MLLELNQFSTNIWPALLKIVVAIHAFFISTSAISTTRLRIGQKISTFCAPPLRLAFVKYKLSKHGYFMVYCKKEIIHLWSDLKVRILSSYIAYFTGGKGPPRELVVTKRGRKGKGAVMMIFFRHLAILHVV